ncbi:MULTISPECIES: pyrroloquinoline quinone biosynthesis protein PqqE [unclassified Rhizobacter]|uniref:pyrroloquinoline quinone biosynthesis protein PqqE n=1 Tax=unclassified Rhizobacter TaxID=2640088 RepID=UPI0006F7E8FA|nr:MULTISPECIES: pyrroloquinoline quinone biosynthesis protein PqqE [unclassified Rhizobacter]KQU77208.1 pyrroloquinoline quinone biosynthesis protein PqqE [Rhizobacter sp. Root29]KQW12720.1 pyrroloquinoline quinone biosynthesis protein PqqE [Rhizobacter sp. Root1238]KRB22308.1 pyrroloquinoline quinone biosynthesis protein PqqE [Rhizobacter sp. Root16D2]
MAAQIGPPLWLLAELTYRCPLHCVFCYNPVDFARQEDELGTEDWLRVLRQGRELGAVQCGLSGGEPLLRDDLEVIVAEAHRLGYYTNLLTSGVGLTEARAAALKQAGLDHVQLSFQDSTREMNDFLSHTKTFGLKNKVAQIIKANGWPMVMNVVIHRMNIDHIDRIIGMAAELGAEYLELANTQYYSWAFLNRDQLLPTHEQLRRAEAVTDEWRERLGDSMRLFFVAPDYHEGKAKKCVNGWGSMFLTVAPDGTALPCHTAKMLPGLSFPNVREHSVRDIWFDSEGFNRYRGTGWMKEPCASCDQREVDLGGCRCQAYLIAHDPAMADPVCSKSPHHALVQAAVERAASAPAGPAVVEHPLVFRDPANSRRLSAKPA